MIKVVVAGKKDNAVVMEMEFRNISILQGYIRISNQFVWRD